MSAAVEPDRGPVLGAGWVLHGAVDRLTPDRLADIFAALDAADAALAEAVATVAEIKDHDADDAVVGLPQHDPAWVLLPRTESRHRAPMRGSLPERGSNP